VVLSYRHSKAGSATEMGRTTSTPNVQKILEESSWNYELNEDSRFNEMYKDSDEASKKAFVKQLHVAKLIGPLRNVIHPETIEIVFDYLHLHRMCWRLLRFTKDHCRDDLIRIFGPNYIEKESQLPFIVEYVPTSATSSQQVSGMLKGRLLGVKVMDKLLTDAKGVVHAMIEQGSGSLIVEHALPKIGVQIDFEFEREE
jgi:hypothetical protein